MDSSLKNKKFGVVHTSPSEMVSSNKLEVGKLYFAQGAASGAATVCPQCAGHRMGGCSSGCDLPNFFLPLLQKEAEH
jgi:hypothetical protein